MRIVHVSTHDLTGGAARSAFRLHQSLLEAGEESVMLVKAKTSSLDSVHPVSAPEDPSAFCGYLIQAFYLDQNRTPISNTYFSLDWPGQDLSSHPLIEQADVIHLHWVTDFLSPTALASLQTLGKPIVWSLHDQRAYTGGCHFSAGCLGYETDCVACPQLSTDPCHLPAMNLADQKALLSAESMVVVAPSRWMASCARRSAFFARCRIETIPYGIDAQKFQPLAQSEARQKLGLPTDCFLLLFGADYGTEKRKGFAELMRALDACAGDPVFQKLIEAGRARLVCFGRSDAGAQKLSVPVTALGQISSDELLRAIYSAADLFLLPSLEDNLPNTALESMSCGTPVAGFSAGGVPDLIIDGKTGFLAPTGDIQKLSAIIISAALDSVSLAKLRPACRRHVQDNFTFKRQADSCLALYRDLLQGRKGADRPSHASGRSGEGPDAGPHFQRIFPGLLRSAFADPDALLSSKAFQSDEKERLRRAKFVEHVKALLDSEAAMPRGYAYLKAGLDAELAILRGKKPWRMKTRLWLQRMFHS